MKIVPVEVKLCYSPDVEDLQHHLTPVGVCMHSTKDNTVVSKWEFPSPHLDTSDNVITLGDGEMKSIDTSGLVVFAMALKCHYLPSGSHSLLVQATGVASREQLTKNRNPEVDLFELSPADSTSTPTHNRIFKLVLFVQPEDSDRGAVVDQGIKTYTYGQISHEFTGMRFPGEGTDSNPDAPFFHFDTEIQRVTVSTSWIAGKPYPSWLTAPRNIRSQQASTEFLRSLVALTEGWSKSSLVTDHQLRWAQLACQLGANMFPYASDFCVTSKHQMGSNGEVRDITFSPVVFGFGDCEDVAHLACSLWILLRDTNQIKHPGWREVQKRMKSEFKEPMVLFCRAPMGDGTKISHASAVVIGQNGINIVIDGVTPMNSFLDQEGTEQNSRLIKVTQSFSSMILCDIRRERATTKGSEWFKDCMIAYLVDPDSTFSFPVNEDTSFGYLSKAMLREVKPAKLDDNPRKLMPIPPIETGAMTKETISSTATDQDTKLIGSILCVRGGKSIFLGDLEKKDINRDYKIKVEKITIAGSENYLMVAHFYLH